MTETNTPPEIAQNSLIPSMEDQEVLGFYQPVPMRSVAGFGDTVVSDYHNLVRSAYQRAVEEGVCDLSPEAGQMVEALSVVGTTLKILLVTHEVVAVSVDIPYDLASQSNEGLLSWERARQIILEATKRLKRPQTGAFFLFHQVKSVEVAGAFLRVIVHLQYHQDPMVRIGGYLPQNEPQDRRSCPRSDYSPSDIVDLESLYDQRPKMEYLRKALKAKLAQRRKNKQRALTRKAQKK